MVCMYIMSIFVLFASNLDVPVNIFPYLTELWYCRSYVKQISKEIWRGKVCLISLHRLDEPGIEPDTHGKSLAIFEFFNSGYTFRVYIV